MRRDGGSGGGGERRRVVRPRPEEEIREEVAHHLELRARDYEARGMDPESARAAALRDFGDPAAVGRAAARVARRRNRRWAVVEWARDVWQDMGFGARQLVRSPGFAAVAVATLALGIGATTSIFTVVQAVLLRPLPYPEAERLVVPRSVSLEDGRSWGVAYPDYMDWRREGVFDAVAVYQRGWADVPGETLPERVRVAAVSRGFFEVMGAPPRAGRYPVAAEYEPGAERVAVISEEYWQRRYGGSPAALGEALGPGDGIPSARVVGVLPAGLARAADVMVPLRMDAAAEAEQERDNYAYEGLARLAPGRSLEATRSALATLAARVAAENPRERADVTITAIPLTQMVVGEETARVLWVLLGAVALVLLIGCANLANLLLGRSAGRSDELAVRRALGASRLRLARQLLAESLVLSAAGGALGLLLAVAGVRGLVAVAPPGVPRLDDVGLDLTVLAFAAGVSVFAALAFGMAPALRAAEAGGRGARGGRAGSRGGGEGGLVAVAAGRTTAGRRRRRLRSALVAAELALSLVLLVGAGLLLRSLERVSGIDPGFRIEDVQTFTVRFSGDRYDDRELRRRAHRELVERLEALPGVESAAVMGSLPLWGGGGYLGRAFLPEGRPEPPAGEEVTGAWVPVSPGYFRTLDVPLLRGRVFTPSDDTTAVPMAIVSRSFAEAAFGSIDAAVGQRIRSWRDENVLREVVGVVGDIRLFGLTEEPTRLFYVPHAQDAWGQMAVVVATGGGAGEGAGGDAGGDAGGATAARATAGGVPAGLGDAIRREVAAIDPAVAVADLRPMEEILGNQIAPRRFAAFLLAAFAALALVLAAVGAYGVLSYTVTQRTREIGVRMALGAERRGVLRLVMGEAAVVVAIGLGLGLAGALALSRVVGALLYDVPATDPVTFAATAVVLAAVALLASLLPALRATRVEPVEAIRN